jgi:O-antigen/teichoic acid export membrane protein
MVEAATLPEPSAVTEQVAGPNPFVALESQALHATLWTVVSYGAAQCLRVANSLILTRLLLPQAFGEMTLVITLIVGMSLLSDIGLEPSVVQSKRGDDTEFLNTAWSLQAIRGAILWGVAALLAWPMARFYHDPTLRLVLPVLALSMLLPGLFSTNLLTLSRHMGVRRQFAVDFSTQILVLAVTVACALRWPSVWALVVGNVIGNIYKLVLSHHPRAVPGIRNRFRWDASSVREIVHFGKWIFLSTAFWFFAGNSDKLILGKLIPLGALGVYGIAFQISDIPRAIINAFSLKVGYPFIAKIAHLPMAEFRLRLLRYRMFALMAGGFLLSLTIVWGGWLAARMYPARYADARWMVPILAAGLWHTLLYQTTGPVLLSLGKSKYGAIGSGAYCVAILAGIPLAFHFYQLTGAIVAVAAGDFPMYLVLAYGATREGVRTVKQDLALTAGFVALLACEFALRGGFR